MAKKKTYSSTTFVNAALTQIENLPGLDLTSPEKARLAASLKSLYSTNKKTFQNITASKWQANLAKYAGAVTGFQTQWDPATNGLTFSVNSITGARNTYDYGGVTPKYKTLTSLRGLVVNQYSENARQIFIQHGMKDVADALDRIILTTTNAYEAHQLLTQTQAYKDRFKGMELRNKSGAAPIDEATYLQLENGYKQTFKAYGIPSDWATNDKLATFIGKDISVQEINQRAQIAYDWSQTRDPNLKAALKTYYNLDDSHLVAYALDPEATIADIEKQNKAAQIGATAVANKFGTPTTNPNDALAMGDYFKSLTDQGISASQASNAFGQTMASAATVNALTSSDVGAIAGGKLTQQEQANATLGLDATARQKLVKLGAAEKALYSGSSGGQGILGNETATSLTSGLF